MSSTAIRILVFGVALALVAACRKDVGSKPDPGKPVAPPREGVIVTTTVFGRVVDERDQPAGGVAVSGGGKTATTDENGYYLLDAVALDQARAHITAKRNGYFRASRVFPAVKDGLTEPGVIKILPQKSIGRVNAATGGTVASAGGTRLALPPNAIDGYSGEVNVVAAYLNPTRPDFFAITPGDMAANNAAGERVGIISYGMTYMELLDDSGNPLQIKDGAEATLTLPVPSTIRNTAEPTIPMWYFDETKGIWVEEGEGKLENGSYVGKVKHFTIWNYDKPAVWFNFDFSLKSYSPKNKLIDEIVNGSVNVSIEQAVKAVLEGLPRRAVVTVREHHSGNTVHSTVANIVPNPAVGVSNYTSTPAGSHHSTVVYPAHTDEVTVTVTPLLPGGPEYPTSPNHSANSDDPPYPETINEGETVEEEVTVNMPPAENTQVEIQIPKGGHQGGNGETLVNVNGRAVDCDGRAVMRGYVYLVIKSGNSVKRAVTAPIYGNEGRFTAQYLFMERQNPLVDNIELTVYDMQAGKKSRPIRHDINPSVALMLPDPVEICTNNGPADPGTLKTIANAHITDAASLNSFVDGGYERVSGTLRIESQAVTDLGSITKLKQVHVFELINTGLANIGGLAQLESITGSIRVDNNPKLTGFVLPLLLNRKLDGGLYFSNNPMLVSVSLPSFENINEVGQAIVFENDPALATLSLPALKTINTGGQINIINTSLEDLETFANATGVLPYGGAYGLNIQRNKKLRSIAGLKHIEVQKAFTVENNDMLASLDGLVLADVADGLSAYIRNNPVLTSVTLSLVRGQGGGLLIKGNAALSSVYLPNATALGGIDITENRSITSIGFPNLKTASSLAVYHEDALTSLQAPLLETLDGQLYLGNLKALKAVDFPKLLSVKDRLEFADCDAITAYDGFNSLQTVAGNFSIHSGKARTPVTSLAGFKKLATVTRSLLIRPSDDNRAPVRAVTGFSSLTTVGETLQVSGENLTSIAGFGKLATAGNLTINNTEIPNLDDLASLKAVQVLHLHQNSKLVQIEGLANLATVSHNLWIYDNPVLTGLGGLEKITAIPDGGNASLEVSNNAALSNLDGLQNLVSIKSGLRVLNNAKLVSLCGISRLVKASGIGGSYYVTGNGYNPTQDDIKNDDCSD